MGLRIKLQNNDKRVTAQFEDVDEMLFKVTRSDGADADLDTMRPCVPKKLIRLSRPSARDSVTSPGTSAPRTPR